ncbi:MAG: ABC transporter permease, partial [Acidobacteriota bacterium]
PVLFFVTVVALATGVVVDLVPALQISRSRIYSSLREGGRGQASGSNRIRQGLVILEVGAALILVVGAGLLLKSFWRINQVDVGVATDRIITARISLPESHYPEAVEIRGFFRELIAELERFPNVEEASMISAVPFSGTYNNFSRVMPAGNMDRVATFVESRTVDSGFFITMGLALRQGRNFGAGDNEDTAPVVMVNHELVRQLFPDDDAVGRTIVPSPTSDGWQIIGVVEDLREHGPDEPAAPTVYFSHLQDARRNMAITARVAGDPMALVPDMRRIVRQIDPDLPLFAIRSLDQLIFNGLGARRAGHRARRRRRLGVAAYPRQPAVRGQLSRSGRLRRRGADPHRRCRARLLRAGAPRRRGASDGGAAQQVNGRSSVCESPSGPGLPTCWGWSWRRAAG